MRILRQALTSDRAEVRAEACRAIWGAGGDKESLPTLERLGKSDPSSSVRFQAKLAVRKTRRMG